MKIRAFRPADEPAVIALWDACDLLRPWNDPRKDIRRKLRVQPELFLVGCLEDGPGDEGGHGDQIVATAMAGYDGHRGWIYYLAVAPELRRGGLGRAMLDEVERRLRRLGCPKINLQVRGGNEEVIGFYERVGYRLDDIVGLGKRLEDDGGGDGRGPSVRGPGG